MGCLGFIGAIIGGALGGFPGAIAGYFLFYFLGSVIEGSNKGGNPQRINIAAQQQASRFFDALMLLSAHVIQADGKIMHSEMELVRNYLRNSGFGEEGVNLGDQLLRQHFNYYKQYGPDAWQQRVRQACYEIRATMPQEHCIQLIAYLADIARADGVVDKSELDAIYFVAANMGLSPSIVDQFFAISSGSTSLDDAYKILGVSPDATDDEVRRAYKKLVLQYHPDKVAHLGEEVKANATKKLQEINKARDLVFKQRGIK